jgi:DNA (cytosine-5)-methyltransferase 1
LAQQNGSKILMKHTRVDPSRKSDLQHMARRKQRGRAGRSPDRRRPYRERRIGAIDLFCGAGGLTKGLRDAGLEVRLGIDLDRACQHPYEANNPGARFVLGDVAKLTTEELVAAWADVDVRVLAGCAPCQPFSSYTQGRSWRRKDQWSLLRAFAMLVKDSRPDVVTMENVASLARHVVFRKFCKALTDQGFHVVWDILDCRNFGIPQSRRRLVLIASRLGQPKLPDATHSNPKKWKTDLDAGSRGDERISDGKTLRDSVTASATGASDTLRRTAQQSSRRSSPCCDWPAKLVAECHRRRKGKTTARLDRGQSADNLPYCHVPPGLEARIRFRLMGVSSLEVIGRAGSIPAPTSSFEANSRNRQLRTCKNGFTPIWQVMRLAGPVIQFDAPSDG